MRICLFAVLALLCSSLVGGASPAAAHGQQGCSEITQPECSIQLSAGITMRYLEVGPRGGPAVIMLHGYTDSARSFSLVMRDLHVLMPWADIIVPDQRGHGQSSMPTGATCPADPESCFKPADFADDVIALMDARHIARAAVVGHSMGSLVAQDVALSHPDRVGKLVLISTGTNGQLPALEFLLDDVIEGVWQPSFVAAGYTWPDGVYNVAPGVAAPDFEDFIDDQWVTDAVADPAFLAELRPETAATPLGTWIGALQGLADANNTVALRHLSVPTLVLWSIQDDVFSRAEERQLIHSLTIAASHGGSFWWKQYGVRRTPASGEQTDFGHNLIWEAPGPVALDIASYLERGRPTDILFHTDYPADIHRVVAEPGRAVLIHEP